MDPEHLRRRESFNADPEGYLHHRPGYPEALFDAICSYGDLKPGDRALEIGCGPGQATVPMAQRGLTIDAVEIGEDLAAVTRKRTLGLRVQIHIGPFESFPLPAEPYATLFSGSAFHWIDPEVRYVKSAEALRQSGSLALFWNRRVPHELDRGFEAAARDLEAAVLPGRPQRHRREDKQERMNEPVREELDASPLFTDIQTERFPFERTYDGAAYVALLDTYSGYKTLEEEERQRLYPAIQNLIETQFEGVVHRAWTSVLYLARKR